jgi:hypothetical protein
MSGGTSSPTTSACGAASRAPVISEPSLRSSIRDQAGRLFENQRLAVQRLAIAAAFRRHDKRRPDIGVARERHFGARGEDADVGRVISRFRRQHKGRFRQVELSRDPLHLLGREPIGVDDHGERVAAELPVGEDVDRDEVQLHGIHLLPIDADRSHFCRAGVPISTLAPMRPPPILREENREADLPCRSKPVSHRDATRMRIQSRPAIVILVLLLFLLVSTSGRAQHLSVPRDIQDPISEQAYRQYSYLLESLAPDVRRENVKFRRESGFVLVRVEDPRFCRKDLCVTFVTTDCGRSICSNAAALVPARFSYALVGAYRWGFFVYFPTSTPGRDTTVVVNDEFVASYSGL